MSTATPAYQQLAWMTDGSSRAMACEGWVKLFARNGASRLHLVHATGASMGDSNPFPHVGEYDEPVLLHKARAHVQQVCDRFSRAGMQCTTHLKPGQPQDVAEAIAHETGVELLICGRTGSSGLDRLLLGSTAQRLVRRAPLDVLVVEAPMKQDPRSVLLPVDPKRPHPAAFVRARTLASAWGVDVHAMAVARKADATRAARIKDEVERLAVAHLEVAGVNCGWRASVVTSAAAAEAIRTAARDHDLVVMGASHRRGLQRLVLGSVTEAVVKRCPASVLVVRQAAHPAETAEG